MIYQHYLVSCLHPSILYLLPLKASYTSSIVANMQQYPLPRQYLTGGRLFHFSRTSSLAAVSDYLSNLTATNARLKVVSPAFKDTTSNVGRYYKTDFSNYSLPSQTKEWSTAIKLPEMHLPAPNDLIPDDFSLVQPFDKDSLTLPPRVVRRDDRWVIWHK